MHRGFMCLFPDPVGGVSGTNPTPVKTTSNKGKDAEDLAAKNKNTTENILVFSNYDSNKNDKVNYSEANSNSLFTRQNISSIQPNEQKLTQEQKNKIIKMALSNFDPIKKFEAGVKKFNQAAQHKEIPPEENGKANQGDIDAAARGLDNDVRTAASTMSQQANEQMIQGYLKAVREAQEQFISDQNSANNLDMSDDKMNDIINGSKDKPKEYDSSAAKNTKTSTEVYSSYDVNPKDTNVNANEMSSYFRYENTTKLAGTQETQTAVANHFGKDYAQNMFNNEIDKFNEHIGTKEIKSENNKNISDKITKATKELNKKAEKAAIKANKAANQQVNQTYQNMLDQAIAQQMAKGSITVDKDNPTKPPEEGTKKDAPAGAERNLRNDEVRSDYDSNKDGFARYNDTRVQEQLRTDIKLESLRSEYKGKDDKGFSIDQAFDNVAVKLNENAIATVKAGVDVKAQLDKQISGKINTLKTEGDNAVKTAYSQLQAKSASPSNTGSGGGSNVNLFNEISDLFNISIGADGSGDIDTSDVPSNEGTITGTSGKRTATNGVYKVQAGEKFGDIANDFGIKPEQLYADNRTAIANLAKSRGAESYKDYLKQDLAGLELKIRPKK